MRVKVREIGGGLHPSEIVVQVETASGYENLVVDRRAISNGTLSVGAPLHQNKGLMLVELPREAMSGRWRVWVNRNSLIDDNEQVAA